MPAYEVEHVCKLTEEQQDVLASTITELHANMFDAPKLFVNVRFTDVTSDKTYVAGKRHSSNRIFAKVRHGPSRTTDHYNRLCSQIGDAWTRIVGSGGTPQELRAIFIEGSLVAGWECGFPLPQAGEDAVWMKTYFKDFQRLADEGDEDFRDLVSEVTTSRPAFKGIVDGQT